MAVATSPYQQNDYRAADRFRPYVLPVNDILKSITANDRFWEIGAERVRNVYQNALNLQLSLEPNKQIRDQFMKDADKELTKLSAQNLADPSVQREGFKIFKPLLQDEGVAFDDATTRHYEKVRNDCLSYRDKDHGKQYSDDNCSYAMSGYTEFIHSTDRFAGKKFYEERREYEPYYDYTEDFQKALKDCPASSMENQSPVYDNGELTGYAKDSYLKSRSALQARNCIEAGLSSKGYRQLQIEGSVRYKNHPEVLASDSANYLSMVSGNIGDELQELAAKKLEVTKSKDIKPEDKAVILKQLDEAIKVNSSEVDKNNIIVNKLNSGDFTPLYDDYDGYAGSVHSFKKLYKKALAVSFEESRTKYIGDAPQLQAIKFTQDKLLKEIDFNYDVSLEQMKNQHDAEMKYLELMYGTGKDGKKGSGQSVFVDPRTGKVTINPNIERASTNITDVPKKDYQAYEKLVQQGEQLQVDNTTNNLTLYNNLIERGNNDPEFKDALVKGFNSTSWDEFKTNTAHNNFIINGQRRGIQETPWFKAYLGQKPQDEDVDRWAVSTTAVNAGIKTLGRKVELAENQVSAELGGDYKTQIRNNIKDLAPAGKITPEDIQSTIEGKPVKGLTIKSEQEYPKGAQAVGEKYDPVNNIYINGKHNADLTSLYMQVARENTHLNKKLSDKRAEVYGKLGFDREPWFLTYDDKSELVEQLKKVFPGEDGKENNTVAITRSDFSGGFTMPLPQGYKMSDALNRVKNNAGIGKTVEEGEGNTIIVRGTNYNVINQAINNPVLRDAAYQLTTVGETTDFRRTEPGSKVEGADIEVPIYNKTMGQMQKMIIKTFKIDGNPEFRATIVGQTSTKPFIRASNAYDLFEQVANTPFTLSKPAQ